MAALATIAALAAPRAAAEWGGDFEPGTGDEQIEWIRPDLVKIVAASSERREALVEAFATSAAADTIEAVKRFRNAELLPLFHRLLRHEDWHVVHRALLALERMEDGRAFPEAWGLLAHGEPRLREKAAITCLRLWDAAGAGRPEDAVARLAGLLETETVPEVRACLQALVARAAGTLHVERVSDEVRVTGEDGLVLTPFLRKMSSASRVAPGFTPRYVARTGKGSALALPVVHAWRAPLLDVSRVPMLPGWRLQPFGEPRNGGRTVHTGVDVGPFLDGAGLYACATGIVKWVYTGSDMGTEIVLEHHVEPALSSDGLATVLYMHAADVVFVAAGDRVEAGQLLGSMGIGFSFENGGHFAHLHLGACPGPFRPDHVYGYKPAADGLSDWLDPATFVPGLKEALHPPRPTLGPVPTASR